MILSYNIISQILINYSKPILISFLLYFFSKQKLNTTWSCLLLKNHEIDNQLNLLTYTGQL